MTYQVTKHYGHNLGLSAAFRQWRASSHCQRIHGYALAITLVFESDDLNEQNWVIDFGSLKPIKKYLEDTFDHKTLVAESDPMIETFHELNNAGIIDMVVVPEVGCEKFAELVFRFVDNWLYESDMKPRVWLAKVTVSEHGANSASVTSVKINK